MVLPGIKSEVVHHLVQEIVQDGGRNELPKLGKDVADTLNAHLPDRGAGILEGGAEGVKLFLENLIDLLVGALRILKRKGLHQERKGVAAHHGVGNPQRPPHDGLVQAVKHLVNLRTRRFFTMLATGEKTTRGGSYSCLGFLCVKGRENSLELAGH